MLKLNNTRPYIGYLPRLPEQVKASLKLAEVTSDDIVYDLGSGDRRVVIAAAHKCESRLKVYPKWAEFPIEL